MTAAGGAAHTGSPTATLAFFNSLGAVSIAENASSSVIEWLEHEFMRYGVVGAKDEGLWQGWSLSSLAVTSPDVPQQPNFHDSGLFALSFCRLFFACPARKPSSLLRADGVGTKAWAENFNLLTRAAMRNLRKTLTEQEPDAKGELVDARPKRRRRLRSTRAGAGPSEGGAAVCGTERGGADVCRTERGGAAVCGAER